MSQHTYKLHFVKHLKSTNTRNDHLYRDAVTGNYVLGQFYTKSASFYPCDKDGNKHPIKYLAELY